MKFTASAASALLALSLSNSALAAPLGTEPLYERAPAGASAGSRAGSIGKTVGSTLLGAGFASSVGTVLSCLQSGRGKKCFGIGLRARADEEYSEADIEADTILALHAIAHMIPAPEPIDTAAKNSSLQARGKFGGAGKAVGTTVLGAGFGSLVGTTISCLESGKGKKCFGLRKREDGVEIDTGSVHEVELLQALANTLKAGAENPEEPSALAERASGGGRASGAAKSVGKTLFGAGLGATIGTTLNCLEQGKGKKCFGLKTRSITDSDLEDDENDEITELMARGVGSAAKSAGGLVGTTLLGSIVSSSVGSIVRCLESGKGKKCFARMAKRTDASELHPDTVQFLQLISELAASQGATAESMNMTDVTAIQERGFGSAAKSIGKTGGSVVGGAIFSNLVNCVAQGRIKACIKNIF